MPGDAEPPRTSEAFATWSADVLGEDPRDARRWYELNVGAALSAVHALPFLSDFEARLAALADSEAERTGHGFLMKGEGRIQFSTKSFEAVLNKALRVNILENGAFPDAPPSGWIGPDRWFQEFDDLVRGQVFCRFVDGPGRIAALGAEAAEAAQLAARTVARQHERGYYAHHLYFDVNLELLGKDRRDQMAVSLTAEIQFATQLQEMMYSITHEFYEAQRIGLLDDTDAWKWATESARFRAAYISHTLHLLEANILDLRDDKLQHPEEVE